MILQDLGLIRQHGLRGPGQGWCRGLLIHVCVRPTLAIRVALAVCLIVTGPQLSRWAESAAP